MSTIFPSKRMKLPPKENIFRPVSLTLFNVDDVRCPSVLGNDVNGIQEIYCPHIFNFTLSFITWAMFLQQYLVNNVVLGAEFFCEWVKICSKPALKTLLSFPCQIKGRLPLE
jgi:hypothetical protein